MSRQSAFRTLTSPPVPLVTSQAGANQVLLVLRQTFSKKPPFLSWITVLARHTSERSIRLHQTCAALGKWVRVKALVKGTVEDRWHVSVTGAGIWLVSQVGAIMAAWTREIPEYFPILFTLGTG